MSKRLSALKKISIGRLSPADMDPIMRDIMVQSDRGAAIIMGALVDDTLAKVIAPRMDGVDQADLFGEHRPMYNLEAKIVIGNALKIYQTHTRKALVGFKEIRNFFAHAPLDITFQTTQIAAYCGDIKVPWLESTIVQIQPTYGGKSAVRDEFLLSALSVCLTLNYSAAYFSLLSITNPEILDIETKKVEAAFNKFAFFGIPLPLP